MAAQKTKTIKEIPTDDLNEWGYPSSPNWTFVGYSKGASRWRDNR